MARVGDMLPRVLASHVDRFKALPSQGGLGGPGSAAEENFFARAFPDDDIPMARLDAARAAAEAITGKGFPKGKGRPGTWVTIGPSNAVYPLFEFRTARLYVPNEDNRWRPYHDDGDRPELRRRPLPVVDWRGGRRHLAREERAERTAELEDLVRPLRNELDRLDRARPE